MLGVLSYRDCNRSVSGVSPIVVVGTILVFSNDHFVIFQVQVFCETKFKLLWVSRVHRDCSFSWHTFSVVVAIFQPPIQETLFPVLCEGEYQQFPNYTIIMEHKQHVYVLPVPSFLQAV